MFLIYSFIGSIRFSIKLENRDDALNIDSFQLYWLESYNKALSFHNNKNKLDRFLLSFSFLDYRLCFVQIYLPDGLTPQIIYIALSAVVAILIWIEGEMLKRTAGKLPQSLLFRIASLIDTSWFFISVAMMYIIELTPIAIAVPAAYGIYTIFGWIYGTRLLRRGGIPDSPKDLVIPPEYIAYSQSFSLIFLALCLLVLASPWLPMPV